MLREWVNRAAAALGSHAEERVTESRVIHGIRVDVVNTRPDIDTARVFQRAESVLALVHAYQPWRLAHLRRDLRCILVKRYPCRGAYLGDTRACLLELTFMANDAFTDAQVAATLVHEGTHARLDHLTRRYGIASYADAPARHERICRRAELELGLAVPDGGPVVERARAAMALADDEVAPAIDWREAGRQVTLADAQALREKGGEIARVHYPPFP